MEILRDILSWTFILIGAGFCLVGAIGILRFPDVYTRMHAAGLIDTAGAGFLVLGLMLQGGLSLVTVKLILILFFLWLTGPTASHALAKAAYHSGVHPVLASSRPDRPREDAE